MPNSPQPLTGDVARRWTQARMPFWAPWLLVAVSVVGVVVSIATDQTVCTPKDPSLCGPDVAFAWAVPLLVTGLLTLWVWPVTASSLVLGYVGLDLVYDPARPAHVAFAVLGLLVLGYAAGHLALRAQQRATLGAIAGPAHRPVLAALAGPAHRPVLAARSWPRLMGVLLGAAIAVVISGTSAFWYAHQVAGTARHVAGSVVVESVAGGVDDGGDQVFTLSSPPAGAPKTVRIYPLMDTYPEGSRQPVRVDLADREWVRLVAEPDDHTDWLSLSIGAGILAALMVAYASSRALNRRRLAELGWSGVGVSVRVIHGEVWVTAADGSHTTLATFATSEDQDELTVRRGVLVGDLRTRGWAAVWTDDAVLLPLSRLAVEGGPEPLTDAAAESLLRSSDEHEHEHEHEREHKHEDEDDEDEVDLDTVGEEVLTRRAPTPGLFPITDAPPPWLRAVGAVLVVGAVVVGPYVAWTYTEGFLDLWPVLTVGGLALERGVAWWASGLEVTPQGTRVDTGYFVRRLPFGAVDRVRVDEEMVVLLAGDDAVTFEPCPDVSPRSVQQARVREVGEIMRGLVDDAKGVAAVPTRRVGPGAVAVVLFVAGVLVAGASRHLF